VSGVRCIESSNEISKELKSKIEIIKQDLKELKAKHHEISKNPKDRAKLDFDVSRIFHENLRFPKAVLVNYDFWRWITMEFFIEDVVWRWTDDPSDINKLKGNSKTVFQRSFGERDRRIDTLRYWVIADRLYCQENGYKYLECIANLARTKKGPFQDFINNIIDNNLHSPNDSVVKTMAAITLNDYRMFSTKNLINSFKRYHVYKNRLLVDGELSIFEKEICLE